MTRLVAVAVLLCLAFGFSGDAEANGVSAESSHMKKAQLKALSQLIGDMSQVRVHWHGDGARWQYVGRMNVRLPGESTRTKVRYLLQRHGAIFGASLSDMRHESSRVVGGDTLFRMKQYHHGVPVMGGELVLRFSGRGILKAMHHSLTELTPKHAKPTLSKKKAYLSLLNKLKRPGLKDSTPAEGRDASLLFMSDGSNRLVYQLRLPFSQDSSGRYHLIDAHNGKYVGSRAGIHWEVK